MTQVDVPAVVLLSGGLDSTVCLTWAIRRYGRDRVRALFFHYSQPHAEPERCAAGEAAKAEGVPIDVVWALHLFGRAGLLAGGFDDARASVVPGRNLGFVASAASHAAGWWPDAPSYAVVVGACLDDAEAYPDCGRPFLDLTSRAASAAIGKTVSVEAPMLDLDKAGVLGLARDLGCLDQALASWSCYRGLPGGPCAACSACRARAKGVEALGLVDRSRRPTMRGGDPARDAALRAGRAGLLRRRRRVDVDPNAPGQARHGLVRLRRRDHRRRVMDTARGPRGPSIDLRRRRR